MERSTSYHIGRLLAIAEQAKPNLKRHFNKFVQRPALLLSQMMKHSEIRHELDKHMDITSQLKPDDLKDRDVSCDLILGYYHQQAGRRE